MEIVIGVVETLLIDLQNAGRCDGNEDMQEIHTFGLRLKTARQDAKLTQEGLANACGMTGGAISQLENGTSKGLNMENMFAVAAALRVSARWLATGKGEMKEAVEPVSDLSLEAELFARAFESLPPEKRRAMAEMLKALQQ